MNPRELEQHLQELLEGRIRAEELQALEHELRSNRDSWDAYRDYVHLHNSLQIRADGIDLMHVIPMDRVIARRRSRDLKKAVMCAAALLLLSLLIAAVVTTTQPKPARLAADAVPGTRWMIDGVAQGTEHDAMALGAGSKVSVESGTLRLRFGAGAEMVVQGPASVSFPELEKPILKHGWMWMDSGKSGMSFEVTTPELVFRDIGTRFGVRVPEQGPAELHVIEGRVEVVAKSTGEHLITLDPHDKGFVIPASGDISETHVARDPFPHLEDLLAAPSSYPTTVLGQNPAGFWRLNTSESSELPNEVAEGLVGRANSVTRGGQPGPRPDDGYHGFDAGNLALRLTGSAADAPVALGTTPVHDGIIFHDGFDGQGPLNRSRPDVSYHGEPWVAVDSQSGFFADGSFVGRGDKTQKDRGGSATLAFKPVDGALYTLDASLRNLKETSNWCAFGFAKGQSSQASKNARFIGGSVTGRAWMIINDSGLNRAGAAVLGTTGTSGALADSQSWEGWGNDKLVDVDLRIILDTTRGPGNWTASWYARKPGESQYVTVRKAARLLNEDITSVGFAVGGEGASGTITDFSLKAERKEPGNPLPEAGGAPARVSLKEGAVSLWIRRAPSVARSEILWTAGRSSDDAAIHVRLEADGRIGFFMENKRYDVLLTSEQGVANGLWHHLAFSWSPQSVEMHIDGRLSAFDNDFRGNQQGVLTDLRFGNGPKTLRMAPFTGLIDEIALWDRPLSHAEVSQQVRTARGVTTRASTDPAEADR